MKAKRIQNIMDAANQACQVEELVMACTNIIDGKGGIFTRPEGILLVGKRLVALAKLEIDDASDRECDE